MNVSQKREKAAAEWSQMLFTDEPFSKELSGPDPLRFLHVALRIEISTRCVFCVAGRIFIGVSSLPNLVRSCVSIENASVRIAGWIRVSQRVELQIPARKWRIENRVLNPLRFCEAYFGPLRQGMVISSCLAIVSILHCSPSPPLDLGWPIERHWNCRTQGESCFVGSATFARNGHLKCVWTKQNWCTNVHWMCNLVSTRGSSWKPLHFEHVLRGKI